MTCSALGRARVAKEQIANECSKSYSKHDPAIVRHEKKPGRVRQRVIMQTSNLHNEKRVEDLHAIESCFDKLTTLLLRGK